MSRSVNVPALAKPAVKASTNVAERTALINAPLIHAELELSALNIKRVDSDEVIWRPSARMASHNAELLSEKSTVLASIRDAKD